MSKVRATGNKSTEKRFQQLLKEHKICGWRCQFELNGRPDFVFLKERIAVFVDGDFWHGNSKQRKLPKTNTDFWRKKIRMNRKRDRKVKRELSEKGWLVLRFWESTLKRNPDWCLRKLRRELERARRLAATMMYVFDDRPGKNGALEQLIGLSGDSQITNIPKSRGVPDLGRSYDGRVSSKKVVGAPGRWNRSSSLRS